MSVLEIFSSEKRDKDSLFDIHFYMEGSFWIAYEWSAYFSRIFPSELNDEEREWVCSICDEHHDRDVNAAKNIKRFALNPQSLVGL